MAARGGPVSCSLCVVAAHVTLRKAAVRQSLPKIVETYFTTTPFVRGSPSSEMRICLSPSRIWEVGWTIHAVRSCELRQPLLHVAHFLSVSVG